MSKWSELLMRFREYVLTAGKSPMQHEQSKSEDAKSEENCCEAEEEIRKGDDHE